MSKIDELLKNEIVEWKKIYDIAIVSGAGVDKKINPNEIETKLLNYMDIYKNRYINKNIPTMIVTAPKIKIESCNVLRGDIFITPSSETTDDIFRSGVIIENLIGVVYSYHITRIRLIHLNFTTSCYLNYVFSSEKFREKMYKRVYGNTRKTITKKEIENLVVPLPSIEIQEKIVEILDNFTNYVTELQTELQNRSKQYNYYRNKLLSEDYLNKISLENNNTEIKICMLKDIMVRNKGIKITAERMKTIHKENGEVIVFAGGNTKCKVNKSDIDSSKIVYKPSIIVKSRGNIDFEYSEKPFTHKNEFWSYTSQDDSKINIKFIYYYLKNNKQYFIDKAISGKLPQISIGVTDEFKIKLPDISLQNRVANVLDKFSSLVENTEGLLPDEISKRQKQYEYYREKLLTFDCISDKSVSQSVLLISKKYISSLIEAESLVGIENIVRKVKLCEIGTFENGTGMPKSMFKENGTVGAIHYGHIYTKYGITVTEPIVFIEEENSKKLKKVNYGDIVIAKTSENVEDVMKSVAYLGKDDVVVGGHAAIFKHSENPKYISYVFNGYNKLKEQKNKLARGVKVIELSISDMEKIEIPLPNRHVQDLIVSKLEKFELLTNSLVEGLPREIELRQKQYEYYREKLLNFESES